MHILFKGQINLNQDTKYKSINLKSIKWWAVRGSNSRPSGCKPDALPTELTAPINSMIILYFESLYNLIKIKYIVTYKITYDLIIDNKRINFRWH